MQQANIIIAINILLLIILLTFNHKTNNNKIVKSIILITIPTITVFILIFIDHSLFHDYLFIVNNILIINLIYLLQKKKKIFFILSIYLLYLYISIASLGCYISTNEVNREKFAITLSYIVANLKHDNSYNNIVSYIEGTANIHEQYYKDNINDLVIAKSIINNTLSCKVLMQIENGKENIIIYPNKYALYPMSNVYKYYSFKIDTKGYLYLKKCKNNTDIIDLNDWVLINTVKK